MTGRTRVPRPVDPEQGSLFDLDPVAPGSLPDPLVPRTRGQIRLARQASALAAGWHPLSLTSAPGLRLHVEAAPLDDRDAPGRRCGGCRFRVMAGGHARGFPKCRHPDPDERPPGGWRRETNGEGTDVRAWWPGCPQHETPDEGEKHGG